MRPPSVKITIAMKHIEIWWSKIIQSNYFFFDTSPQYNPIARANFQVVGNHHLVLTWRKIVIASLVSFMVLRMRKCGNIGETIIRWWYLSVFILFYDRSLNWLESLFIWRTGIITSRTWEALSSLVFGWNVTTFWWGDLKFELLRNILKTCSLKPSEHCYLEKYWKSWNRFQDI